MADEGYRVTDGGALDQDGVYRPGMQGALLDFQSAHGLPQTGDIDPATLRMALAMRHRVVEREAVFTTDRQITAQTAQETTVTGHPGHPGERQISTQQPPPPAKRNAHAQPPSPAS